MKRSLCSFLCRTYHLWSSQTIPAATEGLTKAGNWSFLAGWSISGRGTLLDGSISCTASSMLLQHCNSRKYTLRNRFLALSSRNQSLRRAARTCWTHRPMSDGGRRDRRNLSLVYSLSEGRLGFLYRSRFLRVIAMIVWWTFRSCDGSKPCSPRSFFSFATRAMSSLAHWLLNMSDSQRRKTALITRCRVSSRIRKLRLAC
mmetsp:Transcript_61343/g.118315  ORF Transcript_61343/g.118315 Transcript_61343/m.118315 type:complete len:201 (-) Transcript_61343:880-1482(-)